MSSNEETRENVLKALDFEIRNLENKRQEKGTNYWILLAGLGSIFWLITDEIKQNTNFETRGILVVFVFLSLLFDQYQSVVSAINKNLNFTDLHLFKLKRIESPEIYSKYSILLVFECLIWFKALINLKCGSREKRRQVASR